MTESIMRICMNKLSEFVLMDLPNPTEWGIMNIDDMR